MDPAYDYTGDWKLVAFATCALRGISAALSGEAAREGWRLYDPEQTVSVACSPGKKLIGDGISEDADTGSGYHCFFCSIRFCKRRSADVSQPVCLLDRQR